MVMHPEMAATGIVLCAGASFFFALAESALFSLGKWRVEQLAQSEPGRGRKVRELLSDPQSLLATLVLGNTLANAGLIALCFWFGLSGRWPMGWMIAGSFALMLIGCEVVPKTLAVRAAERWALRVANIVVFVQRATEWPQRFAGRLNRFIARWMVPRGWQPQTTLSDEEYFELFDLAHRQGALGRSEKEMLERILKLDQRTVRDAMKPRARMACIPDDLSVEEMVAAAREHRHQRLPMYDESPDTIVGVLNTRTLLLDPQANFEDAIEFPSFVPETMNLLKLFSSFQRQGRGLAVVLDEFGGTAGLITMEDILEEIIGELRTEGERREFLLARLTAESWRVSGTMRLDEFRREYPALGEGHGAETLGGLLVHQLAIVPARGESAVVDGLKLTATEVTERRVKELAIEVLKKRRTASDLWLGRTATDADSAADAGPAHPLP